MSRVLVAARVIRSPAGIAVLLAAALGVFASGALAVGKKGEPPHTFLADGQGGSAQGTAQPAAEPAAAVLAPGFQDTAVITGLTNPTNLRFASDGRVFVAQKNGVVKVFHSLSDTNPTVVADLSTQVDDYWDRGLLGMALDPNFPSNPYIYLLYTYDAPIGQSAPVWNDQCPTPPGPTTDGCVVSGRLARITLSGDVMSGNPQVLIQNQWCQQYPSHSIGDLAFGPDGALYVSAGDGASWTYNDYGQGGGSLNGTPTPKNPCGDPPAGVGGTETPPTAEGGALRSQSPRRPAGEPVLLNGSLLRVDPATGAGLPDNPNGSSSDANTKRIIAHGLRNPFRFAFRPGTSELWTGDVGYNTWEEINRRPTPTGPVQNFGWPCYEGNGPQPGYQSAGLDICTSLYNAGSATAPYFTYQHGVPVVPGDNCPTGNGSVISGISFYTSGSYPASYNGGLFFADHSRNCIWAMPLGTNGLPDTSKVQLIENGAANPVDIESGPGGDLFYVDFDGGTIHRLSFAGGGSNDLALNQPASASSSQAASLTPGNANDGTSTTRWSSTFTDNQWWQVDLGSSKQVDTVSLNWENAYASTYKIQTSTDGTTFTDAATVNLNAAGWKTTTFTPTNARYIRILGITRATQYGISFWDAQVFGSGGSGGGGVPVNTSPPGVSGVTGQGQTLTTTSGSWSGSPTSYAYQWQRCDSSGANCQPINNATTQTYTLTANDVGQTIRASVTATNGSGPSQPTSSAVTTTIRADLALNQPASASSSQAPSLTPGNANDGSSTTRWASTFTDNQWWQVDLGSSKQVDTVSLNWETAYASTYKIQTSTDGTTFTDAATVNLNAAGWKTTTFTPTNARYIRILGITRATQWGISFWDAQVFGSAGGPVAVIDSPAASLTWAVGDPISFSGHATDPQGGQLPASALTWTEIIHHCTTPTTCHIHNITTYSGVSSGSLNAPDHDYPSWLELQLTATNSSGQSGTTSVSLNPKTVDLGFASSPSGLTLAVGSSNSVTPFTRTVIVNSSSSISAPLSQTLNGTTYTFNSWSDGGAATHNITAPATNATYTATYQGSGGGGVPVNTSPPSVSGVPGQGQTLTTTNGSWSGSPTSYAYRWQRCDSSGANCLPIANAATSKTYMLTANDVGQTIRASVTATNGSGPSQPAFSAVTTTIRADLALNRPASASSKQSNPYAAAKANDGSSTTRWSSTATDNQWWQVDLGSSKQVDTVSLNWETAYASTYKIQTSTDGTTFTDAATVNLNAAGWKTTTFTPTNARYIRILGITRATQYGISFWDAQVFGS